MQSSIVVFETKASEQAMQLTASCHENPSDYVKVTVSYRQSYRVSWPGSGDVTELIASSGYLRYLGR